MRNLLALVGLLVVGFVVLGWYAGWYTFTTEPGADGHRKVNVDFNTKEIVEDVSNVAKKGSGILSNETKGTPSPAPTQKEVKGQTTGFEFNNDGSVKIVLPKLEFKPGQ